MDRYNLHSFLITIGCFSFMASSFCERLLLTPIASIGIILSTILTFVGLFFWVKYYKKKKGHFPNLNGVFDNITTVNGKITLKTEYFLAHILEFWTSSILLVMIFIYTMSISFRNSNDFKAITKYCNQNKEIKAQIGKIENYGIIITGKWVSYGNGTGFSNINFTIIGEKKMVSATAKLIEETENDWTVKNLYIEN